MTHGREPDAWLTDMLRTAQIARSFLQDVTIEQFSANVQLQFAVIRALEVVGEAARHVPVTLREKYPMVPWRQATGMRDRLIHGYFGVDLETVWRTCTVFLPPLIDQLEHILRAEFPDAP